MSEEYTKADIEAAAQACHEANAVLCRWATPDMPPVPWAEAPEGQIQSAISGVKFIIENPDALPSATHVKWMADKARDGWRYGPVKDAEKKEHPCMVAFEALPYEQQAKDIVFKAVAQAVLSRLKGKE